MAVVYWARLGARGAPRQCWTLGTITTLTFRSTEKRPTTEADGRDWQGRGDELFTNLLDRLASATNYKFDRAELKAGSYSPVAHETVELEQQAVRRLVLDLLAGNKSLPMELKAWPPVDQETVERQKAMQSQIFEILDRLSKGREG